MSLIRFKQHIDIDSSQCEHIISSSSSIDVIKRYDSKIYTISAMQEECNIFSILNCETGRLSVEGQCNGKSTPFSMSLVQSILNEFPAIAQYGKPVLPSAVNAETLKNIDIPYVITPSVKKDMADKLVQRLVFQARVLKSATKAEDKKIAEILSYTGKSDAFFLLLPESTTIKVYLADADTEDAIADNLCKEIDCYTRKVLTPPEASFFHVREMVTKANNEHLVKQADEALDSIVHENASQKAEIQKLQQENLILKASIGDNTKRPLLYYGSEGDLYAGEILDYVLEILDEKLRNTDISSSTNRVRVYDVLKSILEANEFKKIHQDQRERLKQALVGYKGMDSKTKSALEDIGFMVEKDKHVKLKYYGDSRYESVLPSSSSDGRAWKNAVSVMRNNCL